MLKLLWNKSQPFLRSKAQEKPAIALEPFVKEMILLLQEFSKSRNSQSFLSWLLNHFVNSD